MALGRDLRGCSMKSNSRSRRRARAKEIEMHASRSSPTCRRFCEINRRPNEGNPENDQAY